MTEPFIGIDFGTCNSSAAWFDPRTGRAEPLLNAEGEDKTPSVVYFGPHETVVGRHAEERLEHPDERKRVLSAVKRDLAKPQVWEKGGRRVTPLDAAALILGKIKRDAEEGHFGGPVARAVITCPADFDEAERDKLRQAASLAGFREVAVLEEPVAAAVAYSEAGVNVGRYVLVYDLGGGTFDLALLARADGEDTFRLDREPRGDRIGGEDFDRAIYDYFEAQFQKETEQPICPDGLDLHLLRQCRRIKESLSTSEQSATLSWYWPGKGLLELKLNRAQLESLVEKQVERTVQMTRSIQEEAVAAGYPVESLILIGGSSRMPFIVQRLRDTLQVEPRKWQKQDVAVALGAAYHAHQLWGEKLRPATVPVPPPPDPGPSPDDKSPDDKAISEPSAEARDLLARARRRFDDATKFPVEETQQHLVAAQNYAQAASDLEPRWAEPFLLKGRILQEKKEWPLAVAAYTAGLRLDPGAAPAYVDCGLCKFMAGNYSGARKDFDEGLRLAPAELAHRYRAATHWRLGSAAAAVIDIDDGLRRANQDTPRAALHAVSGLLLRDELRLLKESIAAFAEALRLLPAEERVLERQQFVEVSTLFELKDRMGVTAVAGTADAAPLNASASALKGRLNLVGWVQQALWKALKALHGDGTRAAAVEFVAANPHETDERLWKADPVLALHLASIWAEKQNASQTLSWLKHLLTVQPQFDILTAKGDPAIGKLQDPTLADFLTPKWTFQEEHGQVLNWLTVTNLSPFQLTALQVSVDVTRSDGKKDEPKIVELQSLSAGASHNWQHVFQAGGWFGRNISQVSVELSCAQGPAQPVGVRRTEPVRPSPEPAPDVRFPLWEGLKAGDLMAFRVKDLEVRFHWCPPGSFKMGSPRNEKDRASDEGQVDVTLTRGFWMAETQVTQGLWKAVMGTEPDRTEIGDAPLLPVYNVRHSEGDAFAASLTKLLKEGGQLPPGLKIALPTEAQWEYAARAGTTTRYHFGDDENKLPDYAWYSGNAGGDPHNVKTRLANPWQLHDMLGNVWEWCADGYSKKLPGGVDPVGPRKARLRVFRGGSWFNDPSRCRSAFRYGDRPDARERNLGFRLAAVQELFDEASQGTPGETRAGVPPLASRWSRLCAAAVDILLTLFVLGSGGIIRLVSPALGSALIVGGVLFLASRQIYLLSTQGQSIGKKFVGIRIMKPDGGNAGFVRAFLLRSCVPSLIGAIPYLGQALAVVDILFIFGDRRRCLHDRIAGTIVVADAARQQGFSAEAGKRAHRESEEAEQTPKSGHAPGGRLTDGPAPATDGSSSVTDSERQFNTAVSKINKGDLNRGFKIINKLLISSPDFIKPWEFCGDWYRRHEDHPQALFHYEEAIKLGTTNPPTYIRAAISASRTGNVERAYTILKQSVSALPHSELPGVLWFNLACYATRMQNNDEAMDCLKNASLNGFTDATKYKNDEDLIPLRNREDFSLLLRQLEAPGETPLQ
jgi:formylglycine-generating enzyme required for sulfatase activity/tetratricopeptide (TPR) repeat protein/uncharacterized RDD family membrane protein YckC